MAKRFTDLLPLTSPATDDLLAIVDVSANTTKKITVTNLLTNMIDAVHLKSNSVITSKILDGAITAAKMGLVPTASTNSGTGGGDINRLVLGNLMIMWGTFNTLSVAASTTQSRTLVFPVAFASAPKVYITGAELTVSPAQQYYCEAGTLATTGVSLTMYNFAGSTVTAKMQWLAIGYK